MDVKSKYTTQEKIAANSKGEKEKTTLSNDAYALCELLEILEKQLGHLRLVMSN